MCYIIPGSHELVFHTLIGIEAIASIKFLEEDIVQTINFQKGWAIDQTAGIVTTISSTVPLLGKIGVILYNKWY